MDSEDVIEYNIYIEDDSKVESVMAYLTERHKDIGLLFNVVTWVSPVSEMLDDTDVLKEIYTMLV